MNFSRPANLPHNLTGSHSGRRLGQSVQTVVDGRVRYSVIVTVGVALVLSLALSGGATGGGTNWPLATVALGLLTGGLAAHVVLSTAVRATKREVRALEQRLSAEASASRVLAGIKLLSPDGSWDNSRGDSLNTDARLAEAARMATGYPAAIVYRLHNAHGVFVPSSWSYRGQLAGTRDEFEPIDGHTPGALAARQGSAIVMSLTDAHSVDLPEWAEQAGFIQGIVTPITRGLDTVGIVYVLNKSAVLPTLSEIEQLELIISFGSDLSTTAKITGNTRITNAVGPGTHEQPFRVPDNLSRRRSSASDQVRMPGFALNPELERMELDGISLSLSPTEFLLVHTLASSPGKPVSPVELVNACWAPDARPADNAIDVAIFRLRRKLSKTASGRDLIKTVRGSGYMFVPPPVDTQTPIMAD